jgi:phosphate transport system permease protein
VTATTEERTDTVEPADLVLTADATRPVRRVADVVFRVLLYACLGVALVTLATLLVTVFSDGQSRLSWDLFTQFPSSRPARAGFRSAIFGSLWVVGLTSIISLPLGVASAVYLEEFARKDRWYNRAIELNIMNLAAVPAVVYGILGLAFIARGPLSLGFTVTTAALILTLVVLPTVIISTREALRAVPPSIREGALALGATRWQTIWRQVLPAAVPGIATGSILSVSRALGESAPLLLTGALTFITFNPTGLDSAYTVMPIAIFNYTSQAKSGFLELAAAGIVVLLCMLLILNGAAIYIRNHFERRW